MKIENKIVNNVLYISLIGELDEKSSMFARSELDNLIDDIKLNKVVIELSKLTFMDSTGVGVLLGRFKKLKSKGIPILIANPTHAIDKLLTLTGIYDIMPRIS